MATHKRSGLKRTARALRCFNKGANKSQLTAAEKRRLGNIKRSMMNAKDDGFIGGNAGISPEHFERSAEFLEELIVRLGLQEPTFGPDGWPTQECR